MSPTRRQPTTAEFWQLHNWQPDTIVEVQAVDFRLPSWDTDETDTVHTAYGYTDALGPNRVWVRWETCDSDCTLEVVYFDNALDAVADWRYRVTQYLLGCRVVEAALVQCTPTYLSGIHHRFVQGRVREAQVSLYAALTGLDPDEAATEVVVTTGSRPKDSLATDGVTAITDWDTGFGHAHAFHHLLSPDE